LISETSLPFVGLLQMIPIDNETSCHSLLLVLLFLKTELRVESRLVDVLEIYSLQTRLIITLIMSHTA
jgi:hypothetical protein